MEAAYPFRLKTFFADSRRRSLVFEGGAFFRDFTFLFTFLNEYGIRVSIDRYLIKEHSVKYKIMAVMNRPYFISGWVSIDRYPLLGRIKCEPLVFV